MVEKQSIFESVDLEVLSKMSIDDIKDDSNVIQLTDKDFKQIDREKIG